MSRIFISYARQDGAELAEFLHQRLTGAGYEVWRDSEDLRVGDGFPSAISDAIEQCQDFLLILSNGALQSKWVTAEINMALSVGKHIISIVLDGVDNKAIPPLLGARNYIQVKGTHDWKALHKLVDNLENGKDIPRVYSMSNRDDAKIHGLLLLGKSTSVSVNLEDSADIVEKAEKLWRDFLPYWYEVNNMGLVPTGLAPLANAVLAHLAGKPNQLPRMYYPYQGPDGKFRISADRFVELQQLRKLAQSE